MSWIPASGSIRDGAGRRPANSGGRYDARARQHRPVRGRDADRRACRLGPRALSASARAARPPRPERRRHRLFRRRCRPRLVHRGAGRVGLHQGTGEATGKPAVAVSNLEVLARFGSAPLRAVLLDARRGQIYGAVYDAAGGIVVPETVATLTDFLAILPAADLEFIAPDFAPFGDALPWTPRVTAGPDLAGQVARIAAERLARGEARDPAALDANYVRRSDAELFWKE